MNGTIGIIGAGISGLSAGIFFRRRGIDFKIFERHPGIEAAGAGIIIPANAMKAYAHLDLDGGISGQGVALKSMNVYDMRGEILSRIEMSDVIRLTGMRSVAIERSILHEYLHGNLAPSDILFGKKLTTAHQSDQIVLADFADGSHQECAALIGADGIHSAVLRNIAESPLRHTGETCYRGIADVPNIRTLADDSIHEFWSRRGRFGYVPVGGERVYWYATVPDAEAGGESSGKRDRLIARFAGINNLVRRCIESTGETQIIEGELFDRAPLSSWKNGRITLLGDAAHPTTPNLGQGAAMGIESAYVLAECLHRYGDTDTAFQQYERLRKKRTRFITETSWRLGKLANIRNEAAIRFRDGVMRITPPFLNSITIRRIFSAPDILFDR